MIKILTPRAAILSAVCLTISACGGGGTTFTADPDASAQWYLTGSLDGETMSGINLPADIPYKGMGILVAIVDNGIDLDHEDLFSNVSYGNFSYLPKDYGFSNADHGTAVAGIIAAAEGNGIGGRGVAPAANIISFNAMRVPSVVNIADALRRELNRVAISNNSWGDFNSWGEPLHLKPEVENALLDGTTNGRAGKGIVYIFSAGNGALIDDNGTPSDNVNYSGLVNNQYTLPICATDHKGTKTSYSETGATLLVCAPSRGKDSKYGIFTTDVTGELGYNNKDNSTDINNKNYSSKFGGTSAAAPMVSGVVAILLEANPSLSWRDVRYILAASARKTDPTHADWTRNGAGLNINHSYGFGLIDAKAALELALNWNNLPPLIERSYTRNINRIVPDNDPSGISDEIVVEEPLTSEFVDIYLDIPDHNRIGDLLVTLTSPAGTKSVLSEVHNQMFETFKYNNWRFGSLRHLGESAQGIWKLEVKDLRAGNQGSFAKWKIIIHGSKQKI